MHSPHRSRRTSPWRFMLHGILLCVALVYLLPLVWMVATSIKPEKQAASSEVRLLPTPQLEWRFIGAGGVYVVVPVERGRWSFAKENYRAVWEDPTVTFPVYLRNTLIVAGLSVVGMTLSSAIVAYGLSRIKWRGRTIVFVTVLVTMMIPYAVLIAPLYIVFRELGWIGTLQPLWVPAWFGGAFNIFLLRQFYMSIPSDLDEAARIDGLGHWGIFWKIILPLSKPALAVVALFHFIYVWNDFLAPLVFLTHRDDFTLALGLQLYQSKAGLTPWNLLMAASTMVIAPVLLLFFLTQRTFVQGMATEGLKE